MKRFATAKPDISSKEVYEDALASTVAKFQNQHDREELGATLRTYNTVRSSIQRTRVKIRPGPQSPQDFCGLYPQGTARFLRVLPAKARTQAGIGKSVEDLHRCRTERSHAGNLPQLPETASN